MELKIFLKLFVIIQSFNFIHLLDNGYNDYCDGDCVGANTVCVDYKCQCNSYSTWNNQTKSCQPFTCGHNSECQTYDTKRFCNLGECDCIQNSAPDHNNGHKCKPIFCSSSFEDIQAKCGKDSICTDKNYCKCKPGHKMSYKTGICEKLECSNSEQCRTIDKNRYCDKDGSCKCKASFAQDDNDQQCVQVICGKDTYGRDCASYQNLGCIEGRCVCQPNYRLNDDTGICEQFVCKSSPECQSTDPNRYCSGSTCQCDKILTSDYNNIKCTQRTCKTKVECSLNNTRCLEGKCECDINHSFNKTTQVCQYYECQHSSECQSLYDHRICVSGQCLCPEGWKSDEANGNKCVKSSATYGKSCDSTNDCLNEKISEVCVNSQCRCGPDFKYDRNLENCVPYQKN